MGAEPYLQVPTLRRQPVQSRRMNPPVVDDSMSDPSKFNLTRPGGGEAHLTIRGYLGMWWGEEELPPGKVSIDKQFRMQFRMHHSTTAFLAWMRHRTGSMVAFLKTTSFLAFPMLQRRKEIH